MRKTYFIFFAITAMFFAACVSFGEPEGFTVDTKEGEDPPFEVKNAYADMRTDISEVHFVIANYNFTMKPKTVNSLEELKSPEQMRVTFGLKGEKGDDFQNPIQPGEYSGNKLEWVDIYHFKRGRQLITNLENIKGTVNIASVTESEIAGTIDITGEGGKIVKGKFTALKIK